MTIQTGGGNDGNLFICAILALIYSSAGRTFASAENIQVAIKGFYPVAHHSSMHANISCWKTYIESNIIK